VIKAGPPRGSVGALAPVPKSTLVAISKSGGASTSSAAASSTSTTHLYGIGRADMMPSSATAAPATAPPSSGTPLAIAIAMKALKAMKATKKAMKAMKKELADAQKVIKMLEDRVTLAELTERQMEQDVDVLWRERRERIALPPSATGI
jgi:hypothetical protein